LSALHGTGIEVSVALSLKRRDIDLLRREIHGKGTKTKARERVAKVAEWAWPLVEGHVAFLNSHIPLATPNALLFPGISRHLATHKHRKACQALGIEDYRLKDSRHTYAVRAIRAGAPFEVVARQLGHVDTTMVVRVYGRFKPSEAEMTDWERIAAIQDSAVAAS
jgi:integrase